MTPKIKIFCASTLFATWAAFALAGLTPVPDFIHAVYTALVALGVFTATMVDPTAKPEIKPADIPTNIPATIAPVVAPATPEVVAAPTAPTSTPAPVCPAE